MIDSHVVVWLRGCLRKLHPHITAWLSPTPTRQTGRWHGTQGQDTTHRAICWRVDRVQSRRLWWPTIRASGQPS